MNCSLASKQGREIAIMSVHCVKYVHHFAASCHMGTYIFVQQIYVFHMPYIYTEIDKICAKNVRHVSIMRRICAHMLHILGNILTNSTYYPTFLKFTSMPYVYVHVFHTPLGF